MSKRARGATVTYPYAGTLHLWSFDDATVTLRRAQLAAFLEATGGSIMARGQLRDITSKHLGAGVYLVSTKARR